MDLSDVLLLAGFALLCVVAFLAGGLVVCLAVVAVELIVMGGIVAVAELVKDRPKSKPEGQHLRRVG